jgi:uncharacterized protein with NRDE domain
MCLIAFALNAHPACPLLIASNRDEYLERPTAPLHRWHTAEGAEVVAGRDLKDGGTWLGVSPAGRVAMLTNVRDALSATGQRSRGELATRWLQGGLDWDSLQASIDPAAYGGFNLVVGDFHQNRWGWLGNRHPQQPHAAHQPEDTRLHARLLPPGVYGLSNAALDTPWPKTRRLVQAVEMSLEHVAQPDAPWLPPLISALGDDRSAPDEALPQTGVPADFERRLSSPFVRMPERAYGTRSSLVVRVTASGGVSRGWQVSLDEWTHGHDLSSAGPAWAQGGHRREALVW